MKKSIMAILISTITIFTITIVYLVRPFFISELNIKNIKTVRVKYYDNDEFTLNSEDTIAFKKILKGKKLYFDSPSCGFYNDFRIIFDNGEEIIPAFDSCDILKDKKSGKYFYMEGDREEFVQLMIKYGISIRR